MIGRQKDLKIGKFKMNNNKGNMSRDPLPEIEMLLILVGPPGCGKTTFSEDLISGKRPEELGAYLPEPVVRTEIKSMRKRDYQCGTLIVEFSTLGIDITETAAEIDRLVKAAKRKLMVIWVIDRFTLARQYGKRMQGERLRRTPEWLRYLRFGKIKQLGIYLLTYQVEKSYRTWGEVLQKMCCCDDLPFLEITPEYGEQGRYNISHGVSKLKAFLE